MVGVGRCAPAADPPAKESIQFDTRHSSFGVKSTCPVFVAAGESNHSGCW